MWLCLPDSFLSIVDKAVSPQCLCVRARRREHILAVFPGAAVQDTPGNDYPFRAEIFRPEVARVIAERVLDIDYANHKEATRDEGLHSAYSAVWGVMRRLEGPRKPARAALRGRNPQRGLFDLAG